MVESFEVVLYSALMRFHACYIPYDLESPLFVPFQIVYLCMSGFGAVNAFRCTFQLLSDESARLFEMGFS